MEKSLVFIGVAHGAYYQGLRQWRQSLATRMKKWRAERRDVNSLRNLSDAELKDIGLSKSDLMSIETGEIFRDNSRCKRWR